MRAFRPDSGGQGLASPARTAAIVNALLAAAFTTAAAPTTPTVDVLRPRNTTAPAAPLLGAYLDWFACELRHVLNPLAEVTHDVRDLLVHQRALALAVPQLQDFAVRVTLVRQVSVIRNREVRVLRDPAVHCVGHLRYLPNQ
jgi:hypothetical protein